MAPPLVLDTNVFDVRGFRHWLRGYPGEKILPVVAYAELGVHLRRKVSQDVYDAGLAWSGILVEWLTPEIAAGAIDLGITRGDWGENARDYLIGAHALAAPRILVTNNGRDFDFVGERVETPVKAMTTRR